MVTFDKFFVFPLLLEQDFVEIVLLRSLDHRRIHDRLPEVKKFVDFYPVRKDLRIPVDRVVGGEVSGGGRGDEPQDGRRLTDE